jgi:GH25 family lysozyme M1 (1,4-beta-N-acetylmuramidase)
MASVTAHGVDIASFQGLPDWKTVALHGFSFAYVKTTQYPHYVSPPSKEQRATAFHAGLTVGNYCYLVANRGQGVAQGHFFLEHSDIRDWHMLPFVDVEESGSEGASPAEIEQCAYDWGVTVRKVLGVKRLIMYTDQNMLRNRIKVTKRLQSLYMLDLADWTLGPPPKIRGWDIVIQQYDTSRGVPGIVGPVDKDRLYVPKDTLIIDYCQQHDTPKPTAVKSNRNVLAAAKDRFGV